jgi:hypothetical protein
MSDRKITDALRVVHEKLLAQAYDDFSMSDCRNCILGKAVKEGQLEDPSWVIANKASHPGLYDLFMPNGNGTNQTLAAERIDRYLETGYPLTKGEYEDKKMLGQMFSIASPDYEFCG